MPAHTKKNFSVLLLYPDYVSNNFGQETCYEFVKAKDQTEALEKARAKCRKNCHAIDADEDLFCLLITEGHNYGLVANG